MRVELTEFFAIQTKFCLVRTLGLWYWMQTQQLNIKQLSGPIKLAGVWEIGPCLNNIFIKIFPTKNQQKTNNLLLKENNLKTVAKHPVWQEFKGEREKWGQLQVLGCLNFCFPFWQYLPLRPTERIQGKLLMDPECTFYFYPRCTHFKPGFHMFATMAVITVENVQW